MSRRQPHFDDPEHRGDMAAAGAPTDTSRGRRATAGNVTEGGKATPGRSSRDRLDNIPLSEPLLAGRELEYVAECIREGWVSSAGKFVARFEAAVSKHTGAAHAVAVQSGTAALHVAMLAAGVEPGTEVLVPTVTFIAPVNAISYCGAHPVFLDVEPRFWQLDADKLESFLVTRTRRETDGLYDAVTRRRISGVVGVHLLGHPFDRDRIAALAHAYALPLIEDAAQSFGALYKGIPLGRDGDYVALSFNGNKVVTCGGGGMVLSSAESVAHRVRHLTTQAKQDALYFVHDELGFNYRLTNVAAAIGTAQLERLGPLLERKRAVHAEYARALADDDRVHVVGEALWARSSFWLPTITVRGGAARRDRVLRSLRAAGIGSRPPWYVNHRQAMYAGEEAYEIEHAEQLVGTGLHLPGSPSLGAEQQAYVIARLRRALDETGDAAMTAGV
ncbi:MAG: aminotransferase class I/II-fold pyridoxal phosphate-dependent enzyme [Gemmatimonadaceae bacterium]